MNRANAKRLVENGTVKKIMGRYVGEITVTPNNMEDVLSMLDLHNDFEKERKTDVLIVYDKPEQPTVETVEEIREESLLSFLGCENNDELLYKFKNSNSREIAELKQVFELIAEDRVLDDEIRLKDKKSLLDFLKFKIGFQEREEFIVIFLNNYNIMTGYEVLFKGTIDKSAIYPREIAERVFKYKAKGVIFAHNHPSGNLRPSKQDISITEHMQEFLDMIDVKLLEHVIITKKGYFSFLEEGLI